MTAPLMDAILRNHIAVTSGADRIVSDAIEQVVHHSERQRRQTFVPPAYPGDVSTLNAVLDTLKD
jgi:hypothetical protein